LISISSFDRLSSRRIIHQLYHSYQHRNMRPTRMRSLLTRLLMPLLLCGLTACVYRVDVQQGNLLDQTDIDAVQIGMTRSQVRFLLGTPVAGTGFRKDRWDYMYYLKPGKGSTVLQHWVIVWFEDDKVSKIDQDVPIDKSS
jgi:outer membrane protein assembly factor BamE